jgi:hypothetical protein
VFRGSLVDHMLFGVIGVLVTQVAPMGAQVPFDFLPGPFIQPARPTFLRAFPQPAETVLFRAMNHPTLDPRCSWDVPPAILPRHYNYGPGKPRELRATEGRTEIRWSG